MGVDQFLLTWNNHRSNFAEVFTQLRVQDQLVDVTLLCDGGSYPAHRLVLAACSPYFHQLFTRLPTHHPLIYLRDVKQAELEALLEFIYRGEVSVANSELTGLIKIAESLRIKGLGDVSQQQTTAGGVGVGEKRATSPASPASPQSHPSRPRKAARISNDGQCLDSIKPRDTNFASLLSPANSYGHAPTKPDGFSQLMESGGPNTPDDDPEDRDRAPHTHNPGWEVSESKLRSCLEGYDGPQVAQGPQTPQNFPVVPPRAPFTPKGSPGKRDGERVFTGRRRDVPVDRRVRAPQITTPIGSADTPRDAKLKENIKTEAIDPDSSGGQTPTTTEGNPDRNDRADRNDRPQTGPDTPILPLYEAPGDLGVAMGDLATPLLASYRHMLSLAGEERAFSPLIPTTVQDQQQQQSQQQPQQQAPSPTNRETRSLTCQLCGATIKHIANFRRHMKQHLNPRRFPCQWCSAAFGRKDNLKTHTRKHHPAEIEAQDTSGITGGTGGRTEAETEGRPSGGLNGLEGRGDEEEEEGGGDDGGGEGVGEDSSDHNEGLVIAEDTDEEEEEDEDSPGQMDDAQ